MSFFRLLLAVAVTVAVTHPGWAQLPVTDGLELWLDAADTSTALGNFDGDAVAFGENVYVWKDKGPEAYDVFTEVTPPVLHEHGINGLPTLRFFFRPATSGFRHAASMIIPDIVLESPYTAFIVNRYWGGDTRRRTLQSADTNWLLGLWAGQVSHYAEGWVTNIRPQAELGFPYLVDATNDGAASTAFINGSDWTSDPAPIGSPGALAIGAAGQFPNEGSDADVSEIILYSRVLSANELGAIRRYLMDKYAIQSIRAVPSPGDCDGNGVVDAADLTCVATIEQRDIVLAAIGSLLGDLDGDGSVDFADFLTMSANFGKEGGYVDGNIDLTRNIEFADFLALSANFGKTADASSVPEPSAFGMAALGFGFLGLLRRRR